MSDVSASLWAAAANPSQYEDCDLAEDGDTTNTVTTKLAPARQQHNSNCKQNPNTKNPDTTNDSANNNSNNNSDNSQLNITFESPEILGHYNKPTADPNTTILTNNF